MRLFLGLLLVGCTSGAPRLTAGACDAQELLRFGAQCRLQVEATCDPRPAPCAAEEACDEELCRACPKATECPHE